MASFRRVILVLSLVSTISVQGKIGNRQKRDVEPFSEPGVILPGITMDMLMQTMGEAINEPTIRDSLNSMCNNMGAAMAQYLGEEVVASVCTAVQAEGDIELHDEVCAVITPDFGTDDGESLSDQSEYNFDTDESIQFPDIAGAITELLGIDPTRPEDACPIAVGMLTDTHVTVSDIATAVISNVLRVVLMVGDDICSASGNWKGVIFAVVGGYGSTDELCAGIQEVVSGDNINIDQLSGLITNSVGRIMEAMHSQDTCSEMLNGINDGLGGIIDVSTMGFDSVDELCEIISSAASGSEFDIDFGSESASEILPGITIADLIGLGGQMLSASDVSSAANTLCSSFSGAFSSEMGDAAMFEHMCSLVEGGDLVALEHECRNAVNKMMDSHSLLKMISLMLSSGKHIIETGDMVPLPDIVGLITNILSVDLTNPWAICPNIVGMVADTYTTMTEYFQDLLGYVLRRLLYLGGDMCRMDSSESSDGGMGSMGSSWFDFEDIDIGAIYGLLFTKVGGYEDLDALCVDVIAATEDEADPALVDDLVMAFTGRIMEAMYSHDTCASIVHGINEGLDGALDVSYMGLESLDQLCEELTSVTTSESSESIDLSESDGSPKSHDSVKMSESDFGSSYGDFDEIRIIDLVKIGGHLLKASNFSDAAHIFCGVFGEMLGSGMMGEEGRMIQQMCYLIGEGDMHDLADGCNGMILHMLSSKEEFSWLNLVLSAGGEEMLEEEVMPFPNILEIITRLLDFDLKNPDEICPGIGGLLLNKNVTVIEIIDGVLEDMLHLGVKIGGDLCQLHGEDSSMMMSESYSKSETSSENSYNASDSFDSWMMDYRDDGVDMGYVVSVIFSAIGGYKSKGEMCDALEEATGGTSDSDSVGSDLAGSIVGMYKERIMTAMYDNDTCSSVLNGINEGLGGALDVTEIGLESIDQLCLLIVATAMEGMTSDLDMSHSESSMMLDSESISGELLLGLTMFDLVKLASHVMNAKHLSEAASIICGPVSEIIDADMLAGKVAHKICDSIEEENLPVIVESCNAVIHDMFHSDDDFWWLDMLVSMTGMEPLGSDEFTLPDFVGMFVHMLGFDMANPDEVCPGIIGMFADKDTKIEDYLDNIIGHMLFKALHAGGKLCHGDGSDSMFSSSKSEYDDSSYGFYSDINFDYVLSAIITAVGDYNSTEELCDDLMGDSDNSMSDASESKQSEYWGGKDDLIEHMREQIMMAIEDEDTCTSMLYKINGGLNGYLDMMLSYIGMDSYEMLCAELAYRSDSSESHFNSESHSSSDFDSDISASVKSDLESFFGDPDKFLAKGSLHGIFQAALRMLRAHHMSDAANMFCNTAGDSLELFMDMSGTMGVSRVCRIVKEDDLDALEKLCDGIMAIVTGSGDNLWSDDMKWPTEDREEEDGWFQVPDMFKMFTMVTDLIDIDLTNPVEVCDGVFDMLTDKETTVADHIDMFLDHIMYTSFHMGVEMCYNDGEDSMKSESFGKDSWADSWFDGYSMDFDEMFGTFFTVLGGYNNTDELCMHVLEAAPETSDSTDIANAELMHEMVAHMKEQLMVAMQSQEICSSKLNKLNDKMPGMIDLNSLGVESFDELCSEVEVGMGSDMSSVSVDLSSLSNLEELFDRHGNKILYGLTAHDIVQIVASMVNAEEMIDAASIACNTAGPILQLNLFDGAIFTHVCNMIQQDNMEDLRDQCSSFVGFILSGGEDTHDDGMGWTDKFDGMLDGIVDIDIDSLLSSIFETLGFNPLEEDVCIGIESLLNSDTEMLTVVQSITSSGIEFALGLASNMCRNVDAIMALDSLYSESSDLMSRVSLSDFLEGIPILLEDFTGLSDLESMCNAVIEAEDNGNIAEMANGLTVSLLEVFTDESVCTGFLGKTAVFLSTVAPEMEDVFFQLTGYNSPNNFCAALVEAFQEKVECGGIPDCDGVCNGNAQEDCAGVCNGNATYDCANECNGAATINLCNECVGGKTGRAANFGMDQCGVCKSQKGYRITWDCHGTCDGSAIIDGCGVCVGGNTGLAENYSDGRLDCRDICDGGWRFDDCGYCEPPSGDNSTASIWMDCSGVCVQPPGFDMAYINDCGVCVGGTTGLTDDAGKNDCGCDSEVSATSCVGCDGVANSGVVYDACGVCGGSGTDCVGVGWVVPDYIPANTAAEVIIVGAGLTAGSTLSCIFTYPNGDTVETDMVTYYSNMRISCMTPSLPADNYTVTIRRDSDIPTDIGGVVSVYDDVSGTSVDPTVADLDDSISTFMINVTAGTGAFAEIRKSPFANPSLILRGEMFSALENSKFVLSGEFLSDEVMGFVVPMPSTSTQVEATPSVNGQTGLGDTDANPFVLTLMSPAPVIESIQFSSNGAGMMATFDRGVQYKSFSSCSDIFDDVSTDLLGQGSSCFFRDPKRLIVVIGKGNGLVTPGDVLGLRSGAVKTFHQAFSREASGNATVSAPDEPLQPVAILQGSPKLPSCGNVRISGRKSTGSGARSMTYAWGVESTANTTSVEAELASVTIPDLTLDGALLEADTPYNFSLTVTNFFGAIHTAYYVVERSALALPEIKIVAKGVDIESASVSDSFDLTTEVTFYSECVPPGATVFSWSVDNGDVPLNLKTIDKRTLHVDENSLPGDEEITFTVEVYKSSDPTKIATASITVVTFSTPLVAIIRGGAEMTVGRDSGTLTIDGSDSFDPDAVAYDMTYTWTCLQETDNTACYSFMAGEEGNVFPSSTSSAVLNFDAMNMQADKTYLFTFTMSKLTRQASASVRISAVSGNPPQVIVELENGDSSNKVTFEDAVPIRAFVKHSVPLTSVVWETIETDSGFGYFNFTDMLGLVTSPKIHTSPFGDMSFTNVIIRSGMLVKGTSYKVLVTASDQDGQTSTSKLTFSVRSGVTSCDFIVADGASSYTELEEVAYLLENCVADEDAYPLSYQIFLVKDDDGNVEAVNQKGSEPSISGVGKPARAGSTNNTFVARVCDKFSCEEFSKEVDVAVKASFSSADITDFRTNQIEPLEFQGDYLGALVNTNMLVKKTSGSRRRKRSYAETTTSDQQDLLTLIENAINSLVLSVDDAVLLVDQLSQLTTIDMSLSSQNEFLDSIKDIGHIFSSTDGAVIAEENARVMLSQIQNIAGGLDPFWNAAMLDKSRSAMSKLMRSLMRGKSLGEGHTDIESTGVTMRMEKNVLDDSFSSAGGAGIDFGDDLKNTYTAAWTCDSGTCSGVSVKTEHYDSATDLLSTSDDDKNSRASDVLSIELSDPDSDDTLNITDLASPITVNLTINSPTGGMMYTCKYWDDTTSAWSTDGVTSIENDDDTVQCQSTHLSTFSVFATAIPTTDAPTVATTETVTMEETTEAEVEADEVDEDDNLGLIIGITVSLVVVVAVVVIVAVVVVKLTKKPAAKRIDDEAPRPPPAQSHEPKGPTYDLPKKIEPAYTEIDPYGIARPAKVDPVAAAITNPTKEMMKADFDTYLKSQNIETKEPPKYQEQGATDNSIDIESIQSRPDSDGAGPSSASESIIVVSEHGSTPSVSTRPKSAASLVSVGHQ